MNIDALIFIVNVRRFVGLPTLFSVLLNKEIIILTIYWFGGYTSKETSLLYIPLCGLLEVKHKDGLPKAKIVEF